MGIAASRGNPSTQPTGHYALHRAFSQKGLELHPIAFDIYGSIGPSAEKGLNPLFEFISTEKGTSPSTERRAVLTQLSSTVLQLSAVAINRRQLDTCSP